MLEIGRGPGFDLIQRTYTQDMDGDERGTVVGEILSALLMKGLY